MRAMRSPGSTPPSDLDAVADAVADLQLVHREASAVDDEGAVDAVAVLHRAVRNGEHLLDQCRLEVHPRERAGLQHAVGVGHQRLERERACLRVDRRADARDLPASNVCPG